MEELVARPRYPRHTVSSRRRRRHVRERSGLAPVIARQLAICLILLAVITLIRSIDTPATNFITGRIQEVLKQNIELKSIYTSAEAFLARLKSDQPFGKQENTAQTGDTVEDPDGDNAQKAALQAKMIIPVQGTLSSGYGERIDPMTQKKKVHEGIDIEANQGEAVLAVLDGVVVETGDSPSYGKYMKIKHQQDLITLYTHCSRLEGTQGKIVKQGDPIARVGDTGASTGAHLHFEVWKGGKPVNPLDYLRIGQE